ncbi:MAG TPA: DUF2207 domain-containing protein [Chloroflexia bacterium]|nr:DUF2207 domain-containing protein [Chloroflexia bacterium]
MREIRPSLSPSIRRFIPLLCWLAVVLPVAGFAAAPHGALAQTNEFHMDQYDAEITVNADSSLDVTETLVYVFDSGSFKRGLREIPLDRVESITGVSVVETTNGTSTDYRETTFNEDSERDLGVPETFGTKVSGNWLRIRWIFPETTSGTRSFRVSYHVTGAIRVYDDRDELQWKAIPPGWQGEIDRSSVTVNLPGSVDVNSLTLASQPELAARTQGNSVTWSDNNVNDGLEIGVQLPKGVVQATKPGWQQAVDDEEKFLAELEKNEPLFSFIALVLTLVILVGGILWVLRRWYRAGRDKPVKLLTDYLTEPPSSLPPGLVGTLLDESADVRDVIATVVDQGTKGNLTIRESEKGGLLSTKDFEYTQTNSNVQYRFEDMVLSAVFSKGSPVRLSDLKNTFYSKLPPIYDEMYRNLVALKYFPENPKGVRTRNRVIGVLLIVLGVVLFFLGITVGLLFSPLMMLPGVAVVIVGIGATITAGAMPRKTDFGSEEAEKWRAFSRYLQQMQKYTNVEAASDKFQKYLPYAVALGIERQLITQFNSVPAAMPTWYAPYGYYPYPVGVPVGGGHSSHTRGGDGGGGVPSFDPGGAMQNMSDSFAGSMQGMANSFTDMVNSASNIMTSQPSSSGSSSGGWGGGGGSFGGGGGGGGGGGAD